MIRDAVEKDKPVSYTHLDVYKRQHNEPIESQTIKQMVDRVMELEDKTRLMILAPILKDKKGTHKNLLDKLKKEGYVRSRHNGDMVLLEETEGFDKNKKHTIDVVVDPVSYTHLDVYKRQFLR